jgi:DNA modification methylase
MPTARLMLGDCLMRMAEIEGGSVDLVLSDLPYGSTRCPWDQVIPLGPLWDHYRRVLKPDGAVVLTATQPFTSRLVLSNPGWFRQALVWEKTRPSGVANANRYHLKAHEDVLIFAPGRPAYHPQFSAAIRRVEGRRTVKGSPTSGFRSDRTRTFDNGGRAYPRSVIRIANPNHANVHPAQKPVALGAYLIRTYTDPGDTVLDNAFGSGSFGVAAVEEGRSFLGIERDPAYFAVAEKRIAAAQAEMPLFPATA